MWLHHEQLPFFFLGEKLNTLSVDAAILVGGFPQHKLLLCPHESQAKPSHVTLSFKPINVTLQNAYQVGGLVGEGVASSLRGVTPRLCGSLELLMWAGLPWPAQPLDASS